MKKNIILVVALFALMAVGVSAQTGTAGLAYASIDNGAAYSVSKGTVTTGAVVILASYNNKPVTTIADNAFEGSSITSVTIPNSVKKIGSWAFYSCTKLNSVTIPASVTDIANQAFDDCRTLTSVTFQGEISYGRLDRSTFGSVEGLSKNGLFAAYYANNAPVGIPGTYTRPNATSETWTRQAATATAPAQSGDPESDFVVRDEGGDIVIGSYKGTKTTVNIPSRIQNLPVTKIGMAAFSNKTTITAIIIPTSVTAIGEQAFAFCKSLTSVTIPNSVTWIETSAFKDCSNLTSVTFSGTIPSGSFNAKAFLNLGDLRDKFYATDKAKGTPGTYTRPNGTSTTWTKK